MAAHAKRGCIPYFGTSIMGFPVTGALGIAIWFGVYALIFGGTLIVFGLRSELGPEIGARHLR